jgi:hypothetical protein
MRFQNKHKKRSDHNQSTSLFKIIMTERDGKPEKAEKEFAAAKAVESMERELATAKAEIEQLRAALRRERRKNKELVKTLVSFASSMQDDDNDNLDVVIDQSAPHEEFPSTESEATARHSPADIPSHQEIPKAATHTSFSVRDSVEEIQRWLFMEGGHMKDVEEMVTEYCVHVRKMGIPLDRLFVGGLMLHPHISAYVWRWEVDDAFDGHEIPRKVFEQKKKLFSADEPFTVLMDGRASSVRMRSTDEHIPKDCQWFRDKGYQDYLALPTMHRCEFMGGIAWSTKTPNGFCEKEIEFFHRSLAALTTVMRLHTNDLVMKTLMGRLENEVANRTWELAAANHSLEKANKRVLQQSAAQLKRFAMMKHEIRTPLNCIIGISSLLLDTGMDATQQDFVRMINDFGILVLDDGLCMLHSRHHEQQTPSMAETTLLQVLKRRVN